MTTTERRKKTPPVFTDPMAPRSVAPRTTPVEAADVPAPQEGTPEQPTEVFFNHKRPRPDDETLWERRLTVVTLRNGGATFESIGEMLKISASQARRDEERALRDYAKDQMEGIVARHRSVLMDIQHANYQAMLMGNRDAAKSILDGLTHEAKLLGMYAPTRIVTGVSEGQFSERFVDLIKAVSPDTLKELLSGAIKRQQPGSKDDPIDAEAVPEDTAAGELDPGRSDDSDPTETAGEMAGDPDGGDGDDWSNL